jgi:hypothetical protein
MRRLLRNSILVLLLVASRAQSEGIRQQNPFCLPVGKATVVPHGRHAEEGTKESYTQGGFAKAIHQFAPSRVVPHRVEAPSPPDIHCLHIGIAEPFLRASFYYSSFCNKAPPWHTLLSITLFAVGTGRKEYPRYRTRSCAECNLARPLQCWTLSRGEYDYGTSSPCT